MRLTVEMKQCPNKVRKYVLVRQHALVQYLSEDQFEFCVCVSVCLFLCVGVSVRVRVHAYWILYYSLCCL